jgi:hypothetical protein
MGEAVYLQLGSEVGAEDQEFMLVFIVIVQLYPA